jgi:hypothetical protein
MNIDLQERTTYILRFFENIDDRNNNFVTKY